MAHVEEVGTRGLKLLVSPRPILCALPSACVRPSRSVPENASSGESNDDIFEDLGTPPSAVSGEGALPMDACPSR